MSKQSKAQAHNEVSQKNIFDNFMLVQQLQMDFAVKGSQNYMSMVCALTGFIKVFKTATKHQRGDQMYQRVGGALRYAICYQGRFRPCLPDGI